ncbi:hypothetical protein B0I35DRAFT_47546 [Stachybotrys elegans]|uniref:Secreted protein n=1 Tax=Stachybotrys elegans TaxID=80388 RepID=A0A8K0T3M5_9HYPO|nr:hypothetical protein B0I35DRAFT_47546 [Stachybotrys elegans]
MPRSSLGVSHPNSFKLFLLFLILPFSPQRHRLIYAYLWTWTDSSRGGSSVARFRTGPDLFQGLLPSERRQTKKKGPSRTLRRIHKHADPMRSRRHKKKGGEGTDSRRKGECPCIVSLCTP